MTSTTEEIERAIREDIERSAELKQDCRDFAAEVEAYWKSIAPVRTGSYRASIHISRERKGPDGLPVITVAATDYKAHWIEYGTGGDTPTPEFAPAAKTREHFSI